ncbi:MAG: sensor histidine kinase [Desulfosarcina sp.]|nr:sensor histidine kinase [Desulfosarcina sp.]MBC2743717.1 sensor histidine kinase [Desulfosarcina sp.]MBC2766626.1 sensor histidine kinase [Desulfosarcina sp.]
MHGSFFFVVLWIVVLLVAIVLGYLQQNRMVKRKTAELRRELFERQMAEKELLASDQKLRQSLAEKESLLKEIHHRVKNNLQIVSSLLYLQEDYMTDPKGVDILRESQNRVKSMALIHEQLYGTADLAKIDFGRYIEGLTANLFDAYGIDPDRIRLNVRTGDIALGVDMAVPCGLIINELVSNALKHAFLPDASGTIDIAIQTPDTGRIEMVVADDGIGLTEPPADAEKKSLGLRLIDTLTAQLDGTLVINTEKGTRFSITLNAPEQPEKES